MQQCPAGAFGIFLAPTHSDMQQPNMVSQAAELIIKKKGSEVIIVETSATLR